MNVSVIGGGVTGLVTAYKLSKEGYKVTILSHQRFFRWTSICSKSRWI